MKLKMGTLTPPQYQHLQKHGWVQLPAESSRHKQQRRAGKLAAQTNAKQKFVKS